MAKALTVQEFLVHGIPLGFSRALQIIGTVLLFFLTFWIPYINIGTTVALFALPLKITSKEPFSPTYIFDPMYRQKFGSSVLLLGIAGLGMIIAAILGVYTFMMITPVLVPLLGQVIGAGGSMMGDYGMRGGMEFGGGLRNMGMLAGAMFPIMMIAILTPVAVLQTSWSLAYLLFIDKGISPMEALQHSSHAMEGQKGSYFLADVILGVGAILLMYLVTFILEQVVTSLQIFMLLNLLFSILIFGAAMIAKMGICAKLYQTRKDI